MKIVTAAAAVVVLAAPVDAAAKNLNGQVCGGSRCVALPAQAAAAVTVDLGDRTPVGPAPAPYYRIDFEDVDSGNSFSHLYVPSQRLMAAGGDAPHTIAWFTVHGAALTTPEQAVAALDPFAARAAWPTSVDGPMPAAQRPPAADRADWSRVGSAAALIVLTFVLAAAAVRRIRVRRPTPT